MKTQQISVIAALSLALAACNSNNETVSVETVSVECHIATWKGDATAAISLTFDDHLENQFTVAQPILDERELKATFYPILNNVSDFTYMRSALAAGHEIGCHTVTHPNLAELTADEVEAEYAKAEQITLDSLGIDILTIAYPYCVRPDGTATENHFIAGRTCSYQVEPSTPSDFLSISSFGIGSESSVTTAEGLIDIFGQAEKAGGWATILFHEIDEGYGYSPFPSAELATAADFLVQNADTYWTATFADVARYARERDEAQLTATQSGKRMTVTLTSQLDSVIYNVPLTVVVPLPDQWTSLTATRDQLSVDFCIADNQILLTAAPSSTPIILEAE